MEYLVVWCPTPPKPRTWVREAIHSRKDLYYVLYSRDTGALRLTGKVVD